MSILSAIKQQNSSIDDLAALPQAMIMQMAQKKQISEEMLAPILARKAEMADAFARQNALQNAGQTPPTVMEQLMAQNAQAEQPQMPEQAPQMPPQMQQPMPQQMPQEMPQDMGVAQLPIPERQYAGGGIIAFADGGMSDYEDDDYEDSLEEADYNSMIERAMNAGEDDYTPTFETRQAKGSPQSFPNTGVGIAAGRPQQDGDIRSRLLSTIMNKESGGNRYDKQGNLLTSPKGAEGEMQVMRYTARDPGFGVKPARNNSPDELKRVGDDYAMAMYNRYKDPKLAMIAYNMGPGATDKWLASGADPRRLPRETQGYISGVNLAQGGEVQHFKNKGSVKEEDYDKSSYEADRLYGDTYVDPAMFNLPNLKFGSRLLEPTPRIRDKSITPVANPLQEQFGIPRLGSSYESNKKIEPKKVVPPKIPDELKNVPIRSNVPTNQELRDFDQATALFQAENMGRNAPTQAQEAPKSRLDEYMDRMIAREASIEKQRGDDKNMALLTAGLGMLGGTSPYAFENIGKGALAGVQSLGESRKQRGAEQAALDKSMLYATRYQGAEDIARQNAAYSQAYKEKELTERSRANTTKEMELAQNNLTRWEKNQLDLYKQRYITDDMPGAQEAYAKIYKNPVYIDLAKRAGVNLASSSPTFTPKQESLLSKYLPK
jgi:hypothetical protein